MYDDNEPTIMGQARPTAALVVRQGTQAGMSFPLSGNEAVIGREEGLDIVLQDPEASRRHARISWQGRQFAIEDLGSTNGTFVNGIQITASQILNPGDGIGIGQTALVFQMSSSGGAAQYQPAARQAPAYIPPPINRSASEGNKTTQYVLYGCIAFVLLLCICSVLVVVALALIDPILFKNITGIDISFQVIQTYLNRV